MVITDDSHLNQVPENEIIVAENPPAVSSAGLKTAAPSNPLLPFDSGLQCVLYVVMGEIQMGSGRVNL